MAGKDALSDAVLGGASDYMSDISTQLVKIFFSPDDEKVRVLLFSFKWCFNMNCISDNSKQHYQYCWPSRPTDSSSNLDGTQIWPKIHTYVSQAIDCEGLKVPSSTYNLKDINK